jgi:outer membrane protein
MDKKLLKLSFQQNKSDSLRKLGLKALIFLISISIISTQCLANTSPAAKTTTFDLKDAVNYAIENSPESKSARDTLKIAELEKESSLRNFFPSLDFTSTHGISDTDPRTKAKPWASQFELSLTESIYDNGINQNKYNTAKERLAAENLKYENQKNKITLQITNQYLNYVLKLQLSEINSRQYEYVKKQYDLTAKYYYQGMKTKKDYLRFKTQLSRSQINLANAINDAKLAKIELTKAIGINSSSAADLEFKKIVIDDLSPEGLLTIPALAEHPLYQTSVIAKKVNELKAELEQKDQFPQISVSTGITYGSSDYLGTGDRYTDNDQIGWNALVTIKYNLWDWGIRDRNSQIAQLNRHVADNDLDSDILQLDSELRQLEITKLETKNNYALAKELLGYETESRDNIQMEYKNGKASFLDLISSLDDFADAETKFLTAAKDLKQTHFEILYHQGKLYDQIIQ